MTVGLVGLHYPQPEHFEAFVERVRQAVAAIRRTPGCLSAECWVTTDGEAVVSTGRWESKEAFEASFAAAVQAGVDFAFDERERLPRQVFTLEGR